MDAIRRVDALVVAEEANSLGNVLLRFWPAEDDVGRILGWAGARHHALCLVDQLGDNLRDGNLVAASGRSLTTTYLRELCHEVNEAWYLSPRLQLDEPAGGSFDPSTVYRGQRLKALAEAVVKAELADPRQSVVVKAVKEKLPSERDDIPDIDDELLRILRTPKRQALARYLWKRDNVSLDELWREVWKEPAPAKLDTVLQFVRDFNATLASKQLRLTKIEALQGGVFYFAHPEKPTSSRQGK